MYGLPDRLEKVLNPFCGNVGFKIDERGTIEGWHLQQHGVEKRHGD